MSYVKWIKIVVDISYDEKMNNYLRPATLFGTKFEAYLNEKPAGKVSKIDYGW